MPATFKTMATVLSPVQPTWLQPPSKAREILADLMVGLGAANIAYFEHWSHLLMLRQSALFWMTSPPSRMRYVAVILNTAILGLAIFLLIRAVRGRGRAATLSRVLLWAVVAVILNTIRDVVSDYYPVLFGGRTWLAIALPATFVLVIVSRYFSGFLAATRRALIAYSVLGFFNVGQAVYQISGAAKLSDLPPARAAFLPAHSGTSPKVVWLVFDDLDYRLLFVDRKQGVSLPVLDDFRRTVIFASHAYPPSNATETSLLTYLLGEKVSAVYPSGRDEVSLSTAEHPAKQNWKQMPNLFSRARESGVNGAVVGWYLPYPRLLASTAVDAWWFDSRPRDAVIGDSLPEMLLKGPRSLIESPALSPFGQSLLTQHRVREFTEFMVKTRQLLADRRVGLLLLHVPVPHRPFFYDRQTGQNSMSNSTNAAYWDALALVDRIVGEVRTQMEQSGEWDSSVILVSSDHYYRTSVHLDGRKDFRVPFLLKMPRQYRRFDFDKPFNTQLSHNMVLDILRGKVRTGEEALDWLKKSYADVPAGWGVRSQSDPLRQHAD